MQKLYYSLQDFVLGLNDKVSSNLLDVRELCIAENAYLRIENFSGTKNRITFTVMSYTTRDAAESNIPSITQEVYTCALNLQSDAPDCIKQGYNYLKTLPEFQDAIDVLEDI